MTMANVQLEKVILELDKIKKLNISLLIVLGQKDDIFRLKVNEEVLRIQYLSESLGDGE